MNGPRGGPRTLRKSGPPLGYASGLEGTPGVKVSGEEGASGVKDD